ncbi:MAG: BamA/TamA family outer membrane protein, partial [Planctomycetes bacterium]|nr:BamA/TamA family outer membrane protein [Planctomycetota bacterium]
SACFQEVTGEAGPVHVRCPAPPEHEYYARVAVQSACTAINAYSQWFGPYLYPEFTIVESYFGWNGNECGGMIMIDHRIFGMPHLAWRYFDGLVAHETCHQWWYNAVGTNGYAETWMDEGLATYFSYHLMQIKYGKNDPLLELPKGLDWLPNIHRDTFTFYGLYGTLGRGDACPTVQDMPKYSHLVNLLSMTYDRGSKVLGMIEDRMGEPAFFAFMATVYGKYQYGMLRVADFQRELEAFTHSSWDEFFRHWVYGAGMTDWCVEKVHVERSPLSLLPDPAPASRGPRERGQGPYRVTVILHQKAQYNEATVLGIRLDHSDDYQIRLPIEPEALPMRIDHPPAVVTLLEDNHFQVEVELPCKPTQIAVDPDQVLLDCNPANNYWKTPIRWRLTPLYTQLEETDLTTDYDRWNVILGPWIYGASYDDPWFTRSARLGLRAGLYRTQDFNGGAYLAFRPDERDLVAGTDGLWDHWPWPHTQVGFVAERGLTHDWHGFPEDRGVLFGRYVFQYGSSLYLPPMKYVEVFTALLEHNLEPAAMTVPGADPFNHQSLAGVHYHVDYLTPYWDPEGGFKFDATYSSGLPILGEREGLNRVDSQFSIVKKVPDGLGFLSETRVAARIYGAAGLPDKGQFYTLGGSTLFRGFDPTDREGNAMWLGSLEWRVPVVRGLECDYVDHTVGLRNVYVAAFYDVGQAFLNGHSLGEVNHALGAGLRMDVAWFSFVERTILRLDVAKAINTNSPWQIWVGVGAPF